MLHADGRSPAQETAGSRGARMEDSGIRSASIGDKTEVDSRRGIAQTAAKTESSCPEQSSLDRSTVSAAVSIDTD